MPKLGQHLPETNETFKVLSPHTNEHKCPQVTGVTMESQFLSTRNVDMARTGLLNYMDADIWHPGLQGGDTVALFLVCVFLWQLTNE